MLWDLHDISFHLYSSLFDWSTATFILKVWNNPTFIVSLNKTAQINTPFNFTRYTTYFTMTSYIRLLIIIYAQAKPITPWPLKQSSIERFDSLNPKHLSPAYSRLVCQKKYVYPVQIRKDYREDIHERLKEGLTWMHENGLTPQLEGRWVDSKCTIYVPMNASVIIRFGKIIWRECIEEEIFDVEKLVRFAAEGRELRRYSFSTE